MYMNMNNVGGFNTQQEHWTVNNLGVLRTTEATAHAIKCSVTDLHNYMYMYIHVCSFQFKPWLVSGHILNIIASIYGLV